MKQLNSTLSGLVNAIPYITVDNGHVYKAQLESPTRAIFLLDDSETGGATLFYGSQALRLFYYDVDGVKKENIPLLPGSYEGPLLVFAPSLSRLSANGHYLYENGQQWTWAMMTGFMDYYLWLQGRQGELAQVWKQAQELGSNGRRVLGMAYYIERFDPNSYGDRYFTEMAPFAMAAASYGQRLHWDVFADNQVYKLDNDFWARNLAALEPLESVIIGAGNEYPKNGFDPFSLQRPRVIASQGSSTADSAPPMPGWGIRVFHGRRDFPKVFVSFDDAIYVGGGLDADGNQYAPVAPIAHDEAMGFAEVAIDGRRSTDPRLARCLMLTGRAHGVGATFHCEDGIYSRLLGPVQQTCAKAFYAAKEEDLVVR